jgi:hypothetical protein
MSHVKAIRELVGRMAIDVLPEQVFVAVDERARSVSVTWQNSKLLSELQRAAILAKAKALLPATMKDFKLGIL